MFQKKTKFDYLDWYLIAVLGAVFLGIAGMCYFRSWKLKSASENAELEMRYYEYAIYLLPFTAITWFRACKIYFIKPQLTYVVLLGLWIFIFYGYWPQRHFYFYEEARRGRELTIDCINQKIENKERLICGEYGDRYLMRSGTSDFTDRVKIAHKLGFKFAKNWNVDY